MFGIRIKLHFFTFIALSLCVLPLSAQNELVPLWKYAAGGELVSPPAVSKYGVYLYSEDRQVHAVSIDGKPQWKFRLSGRPADALAVGRDGTVYAGTSEGRLYAINRGGKQLWRYDAGSALSGPPAVSSDGTVFVGTAEGRLAALSHRGYVRWSIDTGKGISGSPVIDTGEAIYICDSEGTISSFTPWGTLLWEQSPEASSRGSVWTAAIDEHILYSAAGSRLSAIDHAGTVLWTADLTENCTGIVVYRDGLFCSLKSGTVGAWTKEGKKLWIGEGRGYFSYPVSGSRSFFLLDGSGLKSMDFYGRVIGSGNVEGIYLTQPVIGGGLLICGSRQWVACAFNISESEGPGWSQEGGGPGHSGTYGQGQWAFNEADYLKNLDYLYLREAIVNGDQDVRMEAVEEIGDRIEAGGTERGERYLLHLLYIALTDGSRRITVNRPAAANDYPAIRRKAAELIGKYGNFQSVELLTQVLAEEKHYDVSAAIISALGSLGTDYDNLSQWAIYNKVIDDNNGSAYDMLAGAAISAIAEINRYTGDLGSGYGYRALQTIYRGKYSAGTRKLAGEVLRSMR